jgi:hypothetical protein
MSETIKAGHSLADYEFAVAESGRQGHWGFHNAVVEEGYDPTINWASFYEQPTPRWPEGAEL